MKRCSFPEIFVLSLQFTFYLEMNQLKGWNSPSRSGSSSSSRCGPLGSSFNVSSWSGSSTARDLSRLSCSSPSSSCEWLFHSSRQEQALIRLFSLLQQVQTPARLVPHLRLPRYLQQLIHCFPPSVHSGVAGSGGVVQAWSSVAISSILLRWCSVSSCSSSC